MEKILEWDVVKYMDGKPLKKLETNEVSFEMGDGKRFIVSLKDNCIKVYKTGFADDTIEIKMSGSNTFYFK